MGPGAHAPRRGSAFRHRGGIAVSFRAFWRLLCAVPHGSVADMASPFSGVLRLTDLDDYIGPSQVGQPGRVTAVRGAHLPPHFLP